MYDVDKSNRKSHLKRHYKITPDKYNEIFLKQEGKCEICKIHQNELNKKLSVDHCHKTGKIRGLLCNQCNTGLGMFRDNIQLLIGAIKYLNMFKVKTPIY